MKNEKAVGKFVIDLLFYAPKPQYTNMPNTQKVILGLATLWPILHIFIFFFLIFSMFALGLYGGLSGARPPEPPIGLFLVIFPLHILTMVLVPVLLVIYIVNLFKNEAVAQDKKALWAIVLFMGNIIAMPIYWYLYIWQEPGNVKLS